MKKIFISYSSTEINDATEVCDFLESNGFKCFVASRNLVPGKEYAEQLLQNMDKSGVVVFLLSTASNASPHVLREIEYAVSHNIPIIVYRLEEVELSKSMEYFLMTHQWISDSKDKKQELLKGVAKALGADEIVPRESSSNDTPKKTKSNINISRSTLLFTGIIVILLIIITILSVKLIKTNQPVEVEEEPETVSVEEVREYTVGETLTLGSYYSEPIEWRVLKINDDGTLVLLSKYLLSMKIYDAAEGGEYNEYEGVDYGTFENHIVTDEELLVKIRGNNDWSISNIRTWLNSDKEVVTYEDQAPTKKAVGYNFYYAETGFLYNFTEEERAAIVPVTNRTRANSFSENAENGMVVTVDYVYLLSSDEVEWIEEAGISPYTCPTDKCIENDNYHQYYEKFVATYHVKNYYWWLRDNSGEEINKAYVVTTEKEQDNLIISNSVGTSDLGIRPAITIDPQKYSNLYMEEQEEVLSPPA